MDAQFILPKDWDFKRENALPVAYRGYVLRGATVVSGSGAEGNIIIQTFERPLFTIRFMVAEFFRAATIACKLQRSTLISLLALKNTLHQSITDLGDIKLKEGQFSFFQSAQLDYTSRFEKDRIYHSLEINWSAEIIQENLSRFEVLRKIYQASFPSDNFFIGKPTQTANYKLLQLSNELLNSPYDEEWSAVFFEHKVREYFTLLLYAAEKNTIIKEKYTDEDFEKFDSAATLLRQHPNVKFPIAELAANAQMNTTKFKDGFRERYNSGVFEYQMEYKMNEAMRLLEETNLSIKEVCARIGYKGASSFINKFREHFGFPPGSVKKKK